MNALRILVSAAASLAALAAPALAEGVVNIYSSRHYDTDLRLYEEFTEKTGIKVNRLEAGADALIERIKAEGEFSPADLLITVDAGRLWRAEEAGILSAVDSAVLRERLPAEMRHPDGLWFGLSKRARVVIFNKEAGQPEGLATYEDLADEKFRGKVCIRSSSNIYNISLLASIIAHKGPEAAEAWARGVVANFARRPQGNDTSQINAVASGECAISVVNSYYLARFAGSDDRGTRATFDALGVIFPNQGDRGTHVNISGAGVVQYSPNRENAIRFIEYLTEGGAQSYFANGNNEYPSVPSVDASSAVEELGGFEADKLNVRELGVHQAEAVRIFDRVGWP
ncbi:Fe(3+) ABC transporter substrate-binding protein [Parvularcula sp. ZS-1/3]|uniref:Fe(3+) ABC transporter substrate-binding protein n=1 Tax=Parvularcula mediterranea TaxID=2732508 RepID=A0A7Y3RN32_9PROT|nr:Fe(3+) ABC transporter substrate-binding protein [Parvularcula mediterranea]NNU17035.1 Fe(3+) ABC transporter substrate-binding protein [Parvularcula mediterranea]